MALVHRAKLTHYFSPSTSHLSAFFGALTSLYGQQRHCDLKIVAGGASDGAAEDAGAEDGAGGAGVAFGTHQVREREAR